MARVFLRLKLTLLGNGFRRGWQQTVGIVAAAAYALPLAMLGAHGLRLLGHGDQAAELGPPVLAVVFTLLWVGWIVGPLLAFGMDETLDPGRLRLLPLRRRQLMSGLLAASTIGIGPFATGLLLFGVVVGFARGVGALLVVAAVVVQFVLCISTARAVTTALSRRLSSRRGRDLLTVFAALSGIVVAGAVQLPQFVFRTEDNPVDQLRGVLGTVADGLTVLPPAWLARSASAAAAGDLGLALLWLAAGAAAVMVALWWWATGLERAFDAATVTGPARADADLFPRGLRWLPHSRLGAGIAKDLRYAWRVPQQRVQYMILALMVVPTAGFAAASATNPMVVMLAPLGLLLVGATGMNLFGSDRGAVWLLDNTGPRPATDLIAKSVVPALVGLPVIWLVALVLAAVTGGWHYVPTALLLSIGVAGVVGGVGMVVSVLAPFPLPDSPTNVFAANAGAGCATVALQGLGLLVELVVLVPVAILVVIGVLRGSPPPSLAAGVALLLGAAVWWLGLRVASRRMLARGPEFMAALQPRAGA